MPHDFHDQFILYYDDRCPMCIQVMKFIDPFIQPAYVEIVPLTDSDLSPMLIERAYQDILLWHPKFGIWGYDTYCALFRRSSSNLGILFRILSFFMLCYPIYPIEIVYRLVASSGSAVTDLSAIDDAFTLCILFWCFIGTAIFFEDIKYFKLFYLGTSVRFSQLLVFFPVFLFSLYVVNIAPALFR